MLQVKNIIQWRLHRNQDFSLREQSNDPILFWADIQHIRQGDNTQPFLILTKFVFQILTLPHSSANVERPFSQINLNKTKT